MSCVKLLQFSVRHIHADETLLAGEETPSPLGCGKILFALDPSMNAKMAFSVGKDSTGCRTWVLRSAALLWGEYPPAEGEGGQMRVKAPNHAR